MGDESKDFTDSRYKRAPSEGDFYFQMKIYDTNCRILRKKGIILAFNIL